MARKKIEDRQKILRDFYGYDPNKLVTFGTNISVNLDPLVFPNLTVAPAQIKTLAVALGLGGLSTISLASGTYSPFIYFRF